MNLYTATMNLCTTTISLIESEVNCLSYVDIMKHSKFVGRWDSFNMSDKLLSNSDTVQFFRSRPMTTSI